MEKQLGTNMWSNIGARFTNFLVGLDRSSTNHPQKEPSDQIDSIRERFESASTRKIEMILCSRFC